jgi:ribosomal protein S20
MSDGWPGDELRENAESLVRESAKKDEENKSLRGDLKALGKRLQEETAWKENALAALQQREADYELLKKRLDSRDQLLLRIKEQLKQNRPALFQAGWGGAVIRGDELVAEIEETVK